MNLKDITSIVRPGMKLSKREKEVLKLIALGFTDRDIACVLDISPRTVGTYVAKVMVKIVAANRSHAACIYLCDSLTGKTLEEVCSQIN